MKRCVLDASALMAFFDGRPGAEMVGELMAKAAESQRFLLMSVVNWGEVYYAVWRDRGEAAANQKLVEIAQLPIEVVDVDMDTTKVAASLKAQHKLPYVDCFAVALSHQRKATLVTSDRDFQSIQKEVNLVWVNAD